MFWQRVSEDIDYRETVIRQRLAKIGKVVLVTGGKGGVGKSLVSAVTSLLLADISYKTALLDLDLHGPSSSIILKVEGDLVETSEGLIPPVVSELKVMNLDMLVKGRPIPLTRSSKEEVVKEVLALVDFGVLDYLVVDLPPGSGDELLTLIRYTKDKASAMVVTTSSPLSIGYARRIIHLLKSTATPIMGVVENMVTDAADSSVSEMCLEEGVNLLGRIPYDLVAAKAGKVSTAELMQTNFAASLKKALVKSGLTV